MNLLSLLAATAEKSGDFEGLSGALILMAIGMITVFVVLILVIYFGKGLILFVNKFVGEDEPAVQPSASSASQTSVDTVTAGIIAQAVSKLTGGKGKVESIKKL